MKRLVTGVIAALGFAVVATACAGSGAADGCAKAAECNTLQDGQTEAQCLEWADKQLDALRTQGCDAVADALDDYLGCLGTLSCDDLGKDTTKGPCGKELDRAFSEAYATDGSCAFGMSSSEEG